MDVEHDDSDDEPCDCVVCQVKRQIESQGAANCRRAVWIDVLMERIKKGDNPSEAAKFASLSIRELDKAFPEVHAAAMKEDR